MHVPIFLLYVLVECLDALRFETRIFEQKIKDAIEKILEKLRTEGIPALNISSVDPLVLNDLHIGMDKPMIK